MVASGLASFALFTLIFVLCFFKRRSDDIKRKAQGPFVIDASLTHHVPPSSSIVKSYHRVPTSTKEFLSTTSCMENPTHILNESPSGQNNSETEKPLLP